MTTIRIQEADFDIAQEISALTKGRTDIGAVVTFSGICRGGQGSGPRIRPDASKPIKPPAPSLR